MPITPNQYIETLCQLVPDEPTTPGVTLAQAEQSFANSVFVRDEDVRLGFQAYGMENIFTPRRQLRQVLKNTAMHVDEHWNGREAIYDACRLFQKWITPEELGTERLIASHVFGLLAQAYAMSILPEIALCRPHDRPASVTPDGKFPEWHLQAYGARKGGEETASMIQMRLARTFIPVRQFSLPSYFDPEEVRDYLGDYYVDRIKSLAHEMALVLNETALALLYVKALGVEEDCLGRLSPGAQNRYRFENAANALFKCCHGDFTHVIAGPDAWAKLHQCGVAKVESPAGFGLQKFAGLTNISSKIEGYPTAKLWRDDIWGGRHPNSVLLVRNIPHDLAGALAYCPYRFGANNFLGRGNITHEGALDVVEPTHAVKIELR